MRKKPKIALKKITLFVPEELLEEALRVGGENMTQTVRRGLELIAARDAFSQLRKLKGKVKFSLSLDEMRYE